MILNPYLVIKRLHEAGAAGNSQEKYNALVERAIEIGATDLDDEFEEEDEGEPATKAPTSVAPATDKPKALAAAPKGASRRCPRRGQLHRELRQHRAGVLGPRRRPQGV